MVDFVRVLSAATLLCSSTQLKTDVLPAYRRANNMNMVFRPNYSALHSDVSIGLLSLKFTNTKKLNL